MKFLGVVAIAGTIITIAGSMFSSLASVDGYYKADSKGKSVWVNIREEDATYIGNGTFETIDGNFWMIDIKPEKNAEYDSDYDIDGQYVLVMNDNGTENYVYDDKVMEVYEK